MKNLSVSPQEAANELLARRRARNSILAYTKYTFPQYKVDPAHHVIAEHLDAVVAGELTRLAIFAPPQSGKSELVSVRLPSYWLAKRPNDPVILASYAASLAESKSRQARTLVESQEFRTLFGQHWTQEAPAIETWHESRAVNYWQLVPPYRGSELAVGIGGPVTGHGGLLGIIDDPFENWEQAQSLTYRNRAWEWWRTTFRTRIWEGGAIVLIMTRWHPDDLAGRILQEQGAKWTVLRLPALAETQAERDENNKYLGLPTGEPDPVGRAPGEPLTPSRFSTKALIEIKQDVGSLAWAAEYQGVPRAAEGNRFKRQWFGKIVEAVPKFVRRIRYWDKAGTSGGGAYTCGLLMAEHEGNIYIEDVVRGQWSAFERETIIKQTAELDAIRGGSNWAVRIIVEQEPGSGGKESAESTIRNLAGFSIEADRPSGDKDTRLEPFAAQCEAGNVYLIRGEWNWGYIEEMVSIPNGTYRDQGDATAGAFNKLHDAANETGFLKTATRWTKKR